MKKFLLLTGIIILVGTGAYGIYRLSNSMTLKIMLQNTEMTHRNHEPVLGIYDPNEVFSNTESEWQHLALILNNDAKWIIEKNLIEDIPKNQPILLTVEMWDSSVLYKITQGMYDENIRQLFSEILKTDPEIFLRWNPEMEVPAGKYAWESIPNLYIESFQRFSGIIKKISPSTKMVFGPAGFPGALESYPGPEMVDAASITLNSNAEKELSQYAIPDLETQFYRKLHRLRFIDHPIFILGSENTKPQAFNKIWIDNALTTVRNNPEIYSKSAYQATQPDSLLENSALLIGVYDPAEFLINEKAVSIEHLFISFDEITSGEFEKTLKKVLVRDNDLIISIEPGMSQHEIENEDVLGDILSGKYDEVIKNFYEIIAPIDRKLYLRIAHEMEIPVDRYAWQNKDPLQYIKAYRYFMQYPGSDRANIRRVWGPAGDRGSLEYWPGNDVVDHISISIYGLPDKNITNPEDQESFQRIFIRKSWRMRFVDKPFFITEFGVKGDEEYQTQWLEDAAQVINHSPKIMGVSYFNNADVPEAWGKIAPPEWGISKNTFERFIDKLER